MFIFSLTPRTKLRNLLPAHCPIMRHMSVIFDGEADDYLDSYVNRGVEIQDIPQEFAGINTHSVGKQNIICQNPPYFRSLKVISLLSMQKKMDRDIFTFKKDGASILRKTGYAGQERHQLRLRRINLQFRLVRVRIYRHSQPAPTQPRYQTQKEVVSWLEQIP